MRVLRQRFKEALESGGFDLPVTDEELTQQLELVLVRKTPAISKHLKNIYDSGELTPQATSSKMETVQPEGERQITRELEYYNLDAVIGDDRLAGHTAQFQHA